MEQLGFSPVSIKKNTMASPEAGKVHGCQADPMIDRYRDRIKFLTALQIKYFSEKVDFL